MLLVILIGVFSVYVPQLPPSILTSYLSIPAEPVVKPFTAEPPADSVYRTIRPAYGTAAISLRSVYG